MQKTPSNIFICIHSHIKQTLSNICSKSLMKKKIPGALRREVWIKYNGPCFNAKCKVSWCHNEINPFSFECGHNIPESKGGATNVDNLLPICASCNKSMGNRYTITEFGVTFGSNRVHPEPKEPNKGRKLGPRAVRLFSCFYSN